MEIGKIEFNNFSNTHEISNEDLFEKACLKGFIKEKGLEKEFEEYKKRKNDETVKYITDRA